MSKRIKEADEYTEDEMAIIDSEDDMPDGYFDIGEDDIWADDYIGEDDDIEMSDLAESPDDEDFSDFDDDEEVDIEDDSYWADAKEIDPGDFDLSKKDSNAGVNWYNIYSDDYTKEHGKGPFADAYDTAKEEGLDTSDILAIQDVAERQPDNRRFNNAIHAATHDGKYNRDGEFAEPIHYDDDEQFEINESTNPMAEQLAAELNDDPAIQSRLRNGQQVTPEMVEAAMAKGIRGFRPLQNYFKMVLTPGYHESKKPLGRRMKEDTSAFIVTPKGPENKEIPAWVMKAFHESNGSPARFKKICESYLNK